MTGPATITTLDSQLALNLSLERLTGEFRETFNAATIQRYLHSSFEELSAYSTVPNFVPLLAERFTRDRLKALARADGLHVDGKPVVLFLCVHNAGRSQMALGFFNRLAGDQAVAWSGGSQPVAELEQPAVAAMAERGIDISTEFSKPWTDEVVRAADVVVTMGCGEACPLLPNKRYEEWSIADPENVDLQSVRAIRDDIENRVRELIESLGIPVTR